MLNILRQGLLRKSFHSLPPSLSLKRSFSLFKELPDYDDVFKVLHYKDGSVVEINNKLFGFKLGTSVIDFKLEVLKNYPNISSIEVLSEEGVEYHDISLVDDVLEGNFSILINNTDHYMCLNFQNEEVLENRYVSLQEHHCQMLMSYLGISSPKRDILATFLSPVMKDILAQQDKDGKINSYSFRKIVESTIQKESLKMQTEMDRNELMIRILEEKKALMLELKGKAEAEIRRKSNRRLKGLYGLVMGQMFFTQYCTYVKYSWDVMEPICFLFGIFDSILAYMFWMQQNSEYSFESFESNYIDKKLRRYFGKNFNVHQQLEEIDEMLNHLNLKKALHSPELPKILEALDQKFSQIKE